MTHDSDVERVARAVWDVDAPEHRMEWDEETSAGKERYLCIARAALSAMPHAALMREALSALEPFVKIANEVDKNWPHSNFYSDLTMMASGTSLENFRRARAAAQRLRDALTQEKQT